MNRRARLAAGVLLAAGAWLACATTDIHAFIAGQYLSKEDCVTPGYAIDVLNGAMTDASCSATCVVPPFDSGVYVTGACPPFPEGEDVSGKDPLCAKALAASARHDLCLEGGPSNPLMDAGSDAVLDSGQDTARAPGRDGGTAGDATGRHDAGGAG